MSVSLNRRKFLRDTAGVAVATTIPLRYGWAGPSHAIIETAAQFDQRQQLKNLTDAALDAARKAGAVYADVMYTATRRESWGFFSSGRPHMSPDETIALSAGVRALYNGYWGFAGNDGIADVGTMARLGRDAVVQARNSAKGTPRTVDLAPAPVISDGVWRTPVEIDPFEVAPGEKIDFFRSILDLVERRRATSDVEFMTADFTKEERTFASTEGSFLRQTIITSDGTLLAKLEKHYISRKNAAWGVDFLGPAAAGWEHFYRAPYEERIDETIEHAARARHGKKVEVGRYDLVFDARGIASILAATIGGATELDRAMGIEANESGTSFLSEPMAMLGNYVVGNRMINVTANRSMKGGAATVKWDDDGVEPSDATLVKEGILTDFQTMRESASWLAPYYRRMGKPVRSSGAASRVKASMPTAQRSSNLVLAPSATNTTFQDLIADTKQGYAIFGAAAYSDFQCLNGYGYGLMYEIQNGKLGEVVKDGAFLYRTPEFWKHVVGLGGERSAGSYGGTHPWRRRTSVVSDRMYPMDSHTVRAVPAKVTGVAIKRSLEV